MSSIFQDTAFGRLVRLASNGKVFAWEETYNEELLQRYLDAQPPPLRKKEEDVAVEDDGAALEGKQDYTLITWIENDAQNPQNWSPVKKAFVTAQICLLTLAVYVGSAIYTAGLLSVVEDFHVSPVAALLGLSMFVLGYGTGPMLWVRHSQLIDLCQ